MTPQINLPVEVEDPQAGECSCRPDDLEACPVCAEFLDQQEIPY